MTLAMRRAGPLNFGNYSSRVEPVTVPERDPTCPDCKGKCVDRHGFDCVRCAGEGEVDE